MLFWINNKSLHFRRILNHTSSVLYYVSREVEESEEYTFRIFLIRHTLHFIYTDQKKDEKYENKSILTKYKTLKKDVEMRS